MKKLLFLIPAIFLIGASVLLINRGKTSLSADNDPVTLAQYQECMDKNVNNQRPCIRNDSYQNASAELELFFKKNNDCIQFNEYVNKMIALNEQDTALLNYNQLYQKCRANPELIRIVKKNYDCLWEKFFKVELTKCSGLQLW
ncbi:hypothetical protein ABPG74_019210 [Tetrahymena malaccensis]